MDRKKVIETLVKELEEKYPLAKGAYKSIYLDSLYGPNVTDEQFGMFTNQIGDIYKNRHEREQERKETKAAWEESCNNLKKTGEQLQRQAGGLRKIGNSLKKIAEKAADIKNELNEQYKVLEKAKENIDRSNQLIQTANERAKEEEEALTKKQSQSHLDLMIKDDPKKLN